jgi:hypothetical protein
VRDLLERYSRELQGLAALLVLTGGLVHLKLWDSGYRNLDNVGVMFLINSVSSIVIAVALVVWRHWAVVLGAFGLVIGTILAFGVSRTDWDILGYNEKGWTPSPEAALALVVEIAAAVLLVAVAPSVIAGNRVSEVPPGGPPALGWPAPRDSGRPS